MEDVEARFQAFLKRVNLSEETMSTILGGLVVIIVGSLIVNYFQEIKKTKQITPIAASTEAIPSASASAKTYIVQETDHLWGIAETMYGNGEYWSKIAQANQLSEGVTLTAGQSLIIPDIVEMIEEEGTVLSATTIEAIKDSRYIVQTGDTLEKIAERAYGHKDKWPDLMKHNGIPYPDYIFVGMELEIPR